MKIKNLILDSDGVFTDGSFFYSEKGKIMKKYGPDDNDAIDVIKKYLNVQVITGDKRGYKITEKRIKKDMKLDLVLVSTHQRIEWITKNYNPKETIYMGDGIFDILVFKKVAYGIAPANALDMTKKRADFVTKRRGGEGAVAEAVIHILSKFYQKNFEKELSDLSSTGVWKNENNKKK